MAAMDCRRPRDGRVLEELGSYNPAAVREEQRVVFNRDRVEHWLRVGAQPTDTVRRLFEKQGLLEARKRPQ